MTAAAGGISANSLTVTVSSTVNIAVGMAAIDTQGLLPLGAIVTSVPNSTQFMIDRLPSATNTTSDLIGFDYGFALLTPDGYYNNATTIDAPSEFVGLLFDGQNQTGPAGALGNTAGHLLILPMGRCRVSNCCFVDSAGCG